MGDGTLTGNYFRTLWHCHTVICLKDTPQNSYSATSRLFEIIECRWTIQWLIVGFKVQFFLNYTRPP